MECSAGKLQGRYVFTGQGSNLHYGAFDFDGAGKFLGKQTRCATPSRNAKR